MIEFYVDIHVDLDTDGEHRCCAVRLRVSPNALYDESFGNIRTIQKKEINSKQIEIFGISRIIRYISKIY